MLNNATKLLGKPYYSVKDFYLYHMDCMEGLKQIPSDTIHTVITSPPYNIGKEYEQRLDLAEYIDWCTLWLNEIVRILTYNGCLWLNLGYIKISGKANALPLPYLLWDKINLFLMQEIVWNYGAGVACKNQLSPRNEKWLWYVKDPNNYVFNLNEIRDKNVKYPLQKKKGKLRCNPLGKNPSDVWKIAKVTSGKNRSSRERTPHPAQFPLELINRIVKGFTLPEDLILDPFIGSGTTAVSCIANKRKCIGFETNRYYCEIAADRINQTIQSG